MSDCIDVAIVGGGVVGCWLALELSTRWENVFVFEKNPGVTQGDNQSSRNSGVLHAGINYDRKTRPLKARLCVEGNRIWYEFCTRYGIPCKKTGKLMVAASEEQMPLLEEYFRRAQANHVPEVRMVSSREIRELEPNVRGHAGLLVPTSGIIEPTRATYQVHALASNLGAQFVTQTRALSISATARGPELRIRYRDGIEETVSCRWVINSGGVRAVDLARTLDPSLRVRPALIRGDSTKFYRTRRPELFVKGMNVYPTPIVVDTGSGPQHTVGVHLTPTFDLRNGEWVIGDTITVGPKLVPVSHPEDHSSPGPPAEVFVADLPFFPDLTAGDLEPHQGGVQARLVDYPDFLITPDRTCPHVIHLLGIDSPGLTSAPAIARMVSRMLAAP
ncbi:MAG: FAD-dependent oxidoreductase [Thermodesulfobacteriota bacterium]